MMLQGLLKVEGCCTPRSKRRISLPESCGDSKRWWLFNGMHRLGCCRRHKGLSLDFQEDESICPGKMMNAGMTDGMFKRWSLDSGSSMTRIDGFCTDSALSMEEDDSSCSSSKDGFGSFSTARWSIRRLPEDQDPCHEELLGITSPVHYKCIREEKPVHHTEWTDVTMMKERFAKLLLGEDMSGGSKGVSTALALSNAITNLSASVFGELWRLEPLAEERKAKWCKEMDWLISPANYMVELVPARQSYSNGRSIEIMTPRPRSDIHINLPALRKLDAMLIESLDRIGRTEFWYAEGGTTVTNGNMKQEKKWWLPLPKVPVNGLSDEARKKLLYQRDCISQIFKAAKSINEQVLSEMEIPEVYWDTLPKTGKSSLGDALYRAITSEYSSSENVLSSIDLSTEHNALEMANRLEAAIYTWRRRIQGRQSISIEDAKTGVKSSWSLVKESETELCKKEVYMERAENILLHLKNKFPSIPQTFLDVTKIQYNRDVGHSILESYSRVLESLAFNILSRIGDVIREDDSTRANSSQVSPPTVSCIDEDSSSVRGDSNVICPFPSESPSPSPISPMDTPHHNQATASSPPSHIGTLVGEALLNYINRESCFSESDYKDATEEMPSNNIIVGKNSASPAPASPRLANLWCYGREVCTSVLDSP